jgi:hypothetical protein
MKPLLSPKVCVCVCVCVCVHVCACVCVVCEVLKGEKRRGNREVSRLSVAGKLALL